MISISSNCTVSLLVYPHPTKNGILLAIPLSQQRLNILDRPHCTGPTPTHLWNFLIKSPQSSDQRYGIHTWKANNCLTHNQVELLRSLTEILLRHSRVFTDAVFLMSMRLPFLNFFSLVKKKIHKFIGIEMNEMFGWRNNVTMCVFL